MYGVAPSAGKVDKRYLKPASKTAAIHDQAVVGDGSGRVFGVGFDPEDMDEAMNNDLTGVTEAGYADKIATGIDRIKGDYSTLPREMQLLFIKLRALAKSEGIDMERTFQDAGGTRFGTLSKRLFKSALCIAFQHYPFSVKELDDICEAYDCGLPDTFNGGLLDVAWRDFTNDVLSAEVIAKQVAYVEDDMDATDAGYPTRSPRASTRWRAASRTCRRTCSRCSSTCAKWPRSRASTSR